MTALEFVITITCYIIGFSIPWILAGLIYFWQLKRKNKKISKGKLA